jgi:predicted NAD/FAD-dependent oxidoreductase
MDANRLAFDFVIIGSGPAGCACARALLEATAAEATAKVDADGGGGRGCTVAVLEEAGPSEAVAAARCEPEVPACRTAQGAGWCANHPQLVWTEALF